jgi:hypothetical protein
MPVDASRRYLTRKELANLLGYPSREAFDAYLWNSTPLLGRFVEEALKEYFLPKWDDNFRRNTRLKPYPLLAKARAIIADKRHEFEWSEIPKSDWQAAEYFAYSMYRVLKRHKTEPGGVFYNSPASPEDADSRIHAPLRAYFHWRHSATVRDCRARQGGNPGTATAHPVVYEPQTAPDPIPAPPVQFEIQASGESQR